jgi:hypothetical protein
MKKTIRHITVAADTSLRRARGGVVAIWNDSNTIELTMTIREIKSLERRLGIDIEDTISDETMRDFLDAFHGEGMLLDEEGVRI